MVESPQANGNNKPTVQGTGDKSNLVAFRLPPNVISVYEDIAKQAQQIGYIKRPEVAALAKYALHWFASAWIQQQQIAARMQAEQVGERSPVSSSVAPNYKPPSAQQQPQQPQEAQKQSG